MTRQIGYCDWFLFPGVGLLRIYAGCVCVCVHCAGMLLKNE